MLLVLVSHSSLTKNVNVTDKKGVITQNMIDEGFIYVFWEILLQVLLCNYVRL